MAKVEGSNPFIRFLQKFPLIAWVFVGETRDQGYGVASMARW
jgi:hypothetical protein